MDPDSFILQQDVSKTYYNRFQYVSVFLRLRLVAAEDGTHEAVPLNHVVMPADVYMDDEKDRDDPHDTMVNQPHSPLIDYYENPASKDRP